LHTCTRVGLQVHVESVGYIHNTIMTVCMTLCESFENVEIRLDPVDVASVHRIQQHKYYYTLYRVILYKL